MWKEFPPCRGDPCCPLACTRWNYTVFLMFSLTQGGEKLPFYSKRILPLETAKRILEREVSQAKQEGVPAMTVILRGGDPLDRPDDLLDLAEYAGVLGGRARIGVQVMFTADPGRLLAFRKEYSSRYDGAAPVLLARINCHGLDPDVKRLAPECLVDYLREGGSHNPFLRSCNKKLSSWSLPQSKMSLILYAISMRLSGYTSTLSMRRSVSSPVRPSELKTALAASCRLSFRACSSCFCFACANTTA